MASVWADEAKSDELRKLYDQGLSCSQIAGIMGCGLTRNAVIGRVFRLKLPRRGITPVLRKDKVQKPILAKRTRLVRSNSNSTALRLIQVNEPTGPGALRCVEVESRKLALLELEPRDCRFPDGEGTDITFCGQRKMEGSSYCPSHYVLTKGKSYQISEADHERRRRHFMGLNKQSVKAMGVPA